MNGSRSANSAGSTGVSIVSVTRAPAWLLILVDVAMHGAVQVAAEDLLVVQRERVHRRVGFEHRLRGLERVAVLQGVFLERHDCVLLREPFTRFVGGLK